MNSISKTISATLLAAGFTALLALGACGKQAATKDEQAAAAEAGTEAEHAHESGEHPASEEAHDDNSAGHAHAEGEKEAH